MVTRLGRQFTFWVGVLLVFVLMLWLLRSILLPFVAGLALAYFLDPVADFLERRGISRLVATLLILVTFILVLLLALLIIIPLLADQLGQFIKQLPGYVEAVQRLIADPGQAWLRDFMGDSLDNIRGSIGEIVGQGASWLTGFLGSIWHGGQAVISVVSLIVVTPVVAFYMLVDWDRMIDSLDNMLPRRHQETIRALARDMDSAVSGFVRGQALVCLILGLFYAVALTMVGLNFGLLIGLGIGILSFIPFVGSLTGLVLSLGVAIAQFWPDWVSILIVLAIFGAGQFIEGNILQPRLIGRSVGLHPVWLMFALFAFGALFGFVGLLLAVPIAAAVGVLARFAVKCYMESDLYEKPGDSPSGPVI